jgi:hypothetical protein
MVDGRRRVAENACNCKSPARKLALSAMCKHEMMAGEVWLPPRPCPLLLRRSTDVEVPAVMLSDAEVGTIDPRRDSAGIAELLVDVWADEDPYRTMEDPQADLRAEIERSLDAVSLGAVAVDAQGIYATVFVLSATSTAPTLTWLTVRREVRERGLATSLLGVVVAALCARGVGELESATSAANVARTCDGT